MAMKKYLYSIAALALVIAGCAKEEAKDSPEAIQEESLVTYTFTASIEKDDDSKGLVDNSGKFEWAVGDEIALITDAGVINNDFTVTAVSNSNHTATIRGKGVANANFVTAVYPREAAVSGETRRVKFGKGNGAPVVIADITGVANGGAVKFVHVGAIINMTFTGVPTSVSKFVFTPSSTVKSNYDVTTIDPETPANNAVSANSGTLSSVEIPVTFTDAEKTAGTGTVSVSMGVPAASYSGFVVTLDNSTGRHIFKKTSEADFTLGRAIYVDGGSVAYVHPNPNSVKITTESTSKWWDINDQPLIQTSANTFELSINTDPSTTYSIYDEYNEDALTGTINSTETVVVDGTLYVGGSMWGWDKPKGGPKMAYIGSKHIAHNIPISANSYFKITNGNNFESGNALGAYKDGDYTLGVNEKYDSEWNENYTKAFIISSAGSYDFYQENTYVWYKNAGVDDESSHTTLISYDVSTGSATITDKGIAKAAIGNSDTFFNNNIALTGDFNSWSEDSMTMSYNGNHIWSYSLSDLKAGDYQFKVIQKGNWGVQWRNDAENDYPSTIPQLFGTANKQGDSSTHKFKVRIPSDGTYKVYVNDYTWDSNKIKFAFVKQ